ncbi:MAG: radical SAM protein [Actinomycetes bacterium]
MRAHHAQVADVIQFSWVDGPGNRFVLFLQGCNFNCLACHNPQTIPLQTPRAKDYSVEEVLTKIRESLPYITGVTVSGGEATVQHEFLFDLFAAIKAAPDLKQLTTFIDSNGNAEKHIWEVLLPVTDGVMLDLKVLDNERHIALTTQSNTAVLETIKYLASRGKLYEVRLLLIPGQNDSDEELRKTAQWLLRADPSVRVKINAFMSHGVRASARTWAEVSDEDRLRYNQIMTEEGILDLA